MNKDEDFNVEEKESLDAGGLDAVLEISRH